MSSSATKVFWNSDEKRMLATEIDMLLHMEPGIGHTRALERAIEKLPLERRRAVKYWASVQKQLEPFMGPAKLIREKALANISAEQKQETQRVEERLATWMAETVELVAPFVCKLLDHPDIRSKLMELAQPYQAMSPIGQTSAEQAQPRVSRPFRLKVVVAGLLPAQAEEVKKGFSADADLRFWRSDESKDQLRALVKNCDVAVGMTGFLSHSADDILSSNSPRYVRHAGGISRLKDTIATALQHERPVLTPVSSGK